MMHARLPSCQCAFCNFPHGNQRCGSPAERCVCNVLDVTTAGDGGSNSCADCCVYCRTRLGKMPRYNVAKTLVARASPSPIGTGATEICLRDSRMCITTTM